MINNWKLGLKILRHGYGLVMNIIQGIAFLVLGLCFLFLETFFFNSYRGGMPGQVVLMCIGMLPVQMLYSLSASNLVLTSPIRKKLQTSVPAQLTWGCMTLLYLMIVLIRTVMTWNLPELRSSVCNDMVMLGLVAMIIMLYMGIAYKYFMISMIFLIPVIYSSVYVGMQTDLRWGIFNQSNASLILATVMGLVCIAAGAMGQYLLSLLLYKKPLSKMAQAAPLRKEL